MPHTFKKEALSVGANIAQDEHLLFVWSSIRRFQVPLSKPLIEFDIVVLVVFLIPSQSPASYSFLSIFFA